LAPGLGLFNEAILAERGFAAGIYHRSLVITALTSLAGQPRFQSPTHGGSNTA